MLAILIFSTILGVSGIILRVRLADGQMRRIEVDDSDTLTEIQSMLSPFGFSPSNTSLRFRSQELDLNVSSSKSIVKDFGAISGDIITIVKQSKNSTHDSFYARNESTKVDSASPLSKNPKKISQTAPSNPSKGSIAEISKYRNTLVKIARQPSSSKSSVHLSGSTQRIIDRLTKGYLCLLFGKTFGKVDEFHVNVLAAFEIEEKEILANDVASFLSVCELSKALGLELLGCGIGGETLWSSRHVFLSLKLQSQLSGYFDSAGVKLAPFLTLRWFGYPNRTLFVKTHACFVFSAAHSSGAETVSSRSRKPTKERGRLTVEAFHLSDQAILLWKTGILPKQEIRSPTTRTGENVHKIELNSDVLVQSDPTKLIDPILLAVPVAIQPLDGAPHPPVEHIFPTTAEMRDPMCQAKTKSYLTRILRSKDGFKKKLYDLHLLHYFSNLVGTQSVVALCSALSDSSASSLPPQCTMILETLLLLLDTDDD